MCRFILATDNCCAGGGKWAHACLLLTVAQRVARTAACSVHEYILKEACLLYYAACQGCLVIIIIIIIINRIIIRVVTI
jgi:hypothetical protein